MIDPKELRIGNLVDLHIETADRWINERVLSSNDIQCIESGATAQAIPITPEWMERMGFKKYEWSTKFYCYTNGFFEIQCELSKPTLLMIEDQTLTIEFVKYVHQLQNLYFALTGTELEIKP